MRRTLCLWIAFVVSTAYSCAAGPGPVNFPSDGDGIERQLAAPKRLARRDKDLVIVATVEGLLRSRRGIRIFKSEDGWYAGDGYGQSGQYPAMLVLRTIKDAKAEKSHAKARSR